MKLPVEFLTFAALTLGVTAGQAEVRFLAKGHTDFALDYSASDKAWHLHVGSDTTGAEFQPDEVVLEVKQAAQTTVPADAKFSFLGMAGTPVWILPQAQNEKILYLGYAGDGIPEGVFKDDQVQVNLKSVSGPGDFFSYSVDGFSSPRVLFNSRDGISAADVAAVKAGRDAHLNWAFTKAGDYQVTVEVSGLLAGDDSSISSGPVTYAFSVAEPPVPLTNEHVDLRIVYDAAATNKLAVVARDEDHRINHGTNEVILMVAEASKLILPDGTPFGNGGDDIWVLPQSQNPDLLYLGISAEGIPDGVFTGNLNLSLAAVEGPGQFIVWQASQFGDFNIKMDSRNGITAADAATPLIGSHEHYNWGFTATGEYHVTFTASGRVSGESTNTVSLPSTFTFQVLPLPEGEPPSLSISDAKSLPNGSFSFNILGGAGLSVDVQQSGDLSRWTTITNLTPTLSPQPVNLPAAPAAPNSFYRLLKH